MPVSPSHSSPGTLTGKPCSFEPWTDVDIVAAIRYAVRLALPCFEVACEAHDGIAILHGVAMDNYDRLQVLDIAADLPGVRHVIDRLTVQEEPVPFGSRWTARPRVNKAA